MLEIKIGIMLLMGGLFFVGGLCFLPARRFIMPFILTCAAVYFSHWDWWAVSMLSCMGVFCLGYGEKSPLRHCFGNGWGRGVWGLLGAIALSLGLFLSGHLAWYFFVGYLLVNFILENALKDIPQMIGDPIIGTAFGSIILMVR